MPQQQSRTCPSMRRATRSTPAHGLRGPDSESPPTINRRALFSCRRGFRSEMDDGPRSPRYRVPADRLKPRGDSAGRRGNMQRMANRRPAGNPAPDDLPVREELERILASPTFHQSDRLKRFLTFIVREAIEGRRDELKEYVIGVQV